MNKCLVVTLALFGLLAHAARGQGADTLVNVGSYRLHFHILPGHGVPILFDAGGGDDGTVWDGLLAPIAGITGAPLITYDRAGFGKSDIDSHGILNGVEGLEAGLRALGYGGNIVLVAHSYGGLYATLYASRNPTLVKAAVLIDASTACWFNDAFLSDFVKEWKTKDTVKAKAENVGAYYQSANLPQTVVLMRSVTFPSTIPVIDLVSEYPPFSDSGDVARWRDCHKQFVAGHPNREGVIAYGATHYIFKNNPPLVIHAIAKAYAGAVGEPEASAIAKRDQAYAMAATSTHAVARVTGAPGAVGTVFRDCPGCPEMVVLAAGSFTMGSSAEEKSWAASHGGSLNAVADEAPQHQVSVLSFALGKYDVTRGEYAAFVRETGYPAGDGCGRGRAIFKWEKDPTVTWEHPGQTQTDRDPVVCVSWQDARGYIAWLNRKVQRGGAASETGPYRLPSEAEWEYAARGGTTTKFYWGDDDAAAPVHAWFNANSGCENVSGLFCEHGQTHPVGAKPPNAFGLYDMAGNVWQWTEDCYDNSYAGIPADGRANDVPSNDPKATDGQGNCLRVDRGGSWMFPGWLLRPATRERNPADYRADIMGFRVARTLP